MVGYAQIEFRIKKYIGLSMYLHAMSIPMFSLVLCDFYFYWIVFAVCHRLFECGLNAVVFGIAM